MSNVDPKLILENLQNTLKQNNVDYDRIVEELGQVSKVELKREGYQFTLEDHIKALILAMLSNQRPWEPISANMDKIDSIFNDYDPDVLENYEPKKLVEHITDIKCGNISIRKQMDDLAHNICQLKIIEQDYDSLDSFVSSKKPEEVARIISDPNSKYKIKNLGFTLAMEYLKNVGISGMKPDLHILRICGTERLNIISEHKPAEDQLFLFDKFADEANVSTVYLDNLFWIFGAKDYGNICSAKPECHKCELKSYCNYSKNTKSKLN